MMCSHALVLTDVLTSTDSCMNGMRLGQHPSKVKEVLCTNLDPITTQLQALKQKVATTHERVLMIGLA